MTAGDIRRAKRGQVLVAAAETMEVVGEYAERCIGEGHLVVKRSTNVMGETTEARVLGPDAGEAAVCLPCQWERTRCVVMRVRAVINPAEEVNKEKRCTHLYIPPSWGRDEPHH